MSALSVITGLMPLIKSAAEAIQAFTGDEQQARSDNTVQDALEVIGAVAPLVDDFARGGQVTPEDARAALADMDPALREFDAEILRQEQAGS